MALLRSLLASGLTSLALLALPATPTQAAPNNMIALGVAGSANTLFRFSAETPGTTTQTPVSGLGTATLIGIDFRPATQTLYGVGVAGETVTLFAIDPTSGVATPVGSATVAVTGATAFGIGFNPVADRLRVVDDLETGASNFRLNPNNGSLAALDVPLDFSGLPGGAANAPETAIAYDHDVLGATATTLYGIVTGGDRLGTQGSPSGTPNANSGVLFDVGPLGVDASKNAGLDIDPATGEAHAVLEVAGVSGLYRIDLGSGAATALGTVASGATGFAGLAIGPQLPTSPPPPAVPILESLSVSPHAFRAAGGKGRKAAGSAKKAPLGATIDYSISAPATIAFSVERKRLGRKVGKACKPKTRANVKHKPCPIWAVSKPSFSDAAETGANSLPFNGRLGRRPLQPGAYKLIARVGSSLLSTRFRIVP